MLTLRFVVCALAALALLSACGGAISSSKPAENPSPTVSPGKSQSDTEAASIGRGGFECSDRRSGGPQNLRAQLTDVRIARHDGFDRITFQFFPASASQSGSTQVPAYRLEPQPSAGFSRDPSGAPMQLDGVAGLRIVFLDTSAVNDAGKQTYTGSTDFRPRLPFIREAALLGDFERVTSWGLGLGSPGCLRVTELVNPSRLAIDVRSMPAGHQCPGPNPATQPTPRRASDQPGAPVTTAFIVGTVCSSSTGQPLAGATVVVELRDQSCHQGHQPWRCATSTTTDGSGYYGLAVFDTGTYHLTVQQAGRGSVSGDVAVTGPGTFTASWPLP
jgi:Carboxypeptidase regulatory-like domain